MTELGGTVLAEIQKIATQELEFQGALAPAMRLHEDLQLDSMSMIVVAVGLENKFRVRLAEEDAGTLLTVADLIALVERRVKEQP